MLYLYFSLYFVLWTLKSDKKRLSLRVCFSLCCRRGYCSAQVLCWLPLTHAFQQPRAQLLVPSMAQWPGRFLGTTLPPPRHLLVDTDEPPLWRLSFLLSLMLMEGHFILRIQVSLCLAGARSSGAPFEGNYFKLFLPVIDNNWNRVISCLFLFWEVRTWILSF